MSVHDIPASGVGYEFALRCDAVHPVRCDEELRSATRQGVVALACEHGAHEHGFTRGWYNPRRLATMAESVTRRYGS